MPPMSQFTHDAAFVANKYVCVKLTFVCAGTPTKTGILLTQKKYVTDLLRKTNMLECKPLATSMSSSDKLSRENGVALRIICFSVEILETRLSISFANKVCQFLQAPTETHWSAGKRILRYIRGSSQSDCIFKDHHRLYSVPFQILIGLGV